MINKNKVVRALGLCSGGLDSILSALILRFQGIEVKWISFETPFFSSDKAKCAATENDIGIKVINITEIFMEMMKNPDCKFGKNMNPCMDCHSLMFRLAGNVMDIGRFDFMFSGEVLGQRPMSQTRSSLRYVEKHSGYDGHILRPLSAKKLPQTSLEKTGKVNRNLLLGMSGRSRKPQIALAEKLSVKNYPSPGGGCLLTDKTYCKRLRDLFDHQIIYPENDLHLLKFGRHFRLDNNTKIIVSRNKNENNDIERYIDFNNDIILTILENPGPLVVMPGGGTDTLVEFAASICIGYSKTENSTYAMVSVELRGAKKKIRVMGLPLNESRRFMIS